ncbi:hypothetical protein CKN82_07030 [Carnobacterium divergens]|nr:hypothetical protein CKN70_07080 [Carnobacterium divergens]TFI81259.1 hypothetical protein CKN68_07040 [Carnobacterium divergens]TFI88751.1 hypothetical protein CKN72_06910 [Carnobacterium divergens]TFI90122.1 hypothetical protein CKN61_07445 [Carnobacterium divergens]TFI97820.1 hypothetical protein CKN67_07045 [Carnobacterium divergens]
MRGVFKRLLFLGMSILTLSIALLLIFCLLVVVGFIFIKVLETNIFWKLLGVVSIIGLFGTVWQTSNWLMVVFKRKGECK